MMKAHYLSLGILLAQIPLLAKECTTAKLIGGTTCSDLKIKIDASECGGADEATEITSKCVKGEAHAKWQGVDNAYLVVFKEVDGQWGEKSWAQSGKVAITKTPRKIKQHSKWHEPEPERVVTRKPNRESVFQAKPLADISQTAGNQQPATATPASPAPNDRQPASTPAENPLKFSGYLDVYYTYNSNKPANDLNERPGRHNRQLKMAHAIMTYTMTKSP